MNIVVCVKHVPDAQSDLTFNESDNTTDRAGVDGLLSELDEYAIEAGLKLVESAVAGGSADRWALMRVSTSKTKRSTDPTPWRPR